MNVLLIAVLIIIIGCMVWGYWKGLIHIVFSLVTMLLTIALVAWATPYVSGFLKENTGIYENLVNYCTEKIQLSAEENEEHEEQAEIQEDRIQLPDLWIRQIMENAGNTADTVLEENGIYQQAGAYIAEWVLRGIAFFAAFFLVSIVLKLVFGLLDIMAKLPLIKGVNRLLGGAAGLLEGLIIVWLLLFMVAIACTSQLGQTALYYINKSEFLTFLYQNNGILYFMNYMFR